MNLLYPKFPLKHLPHMVFLCVLGTLIAGIYGIIHDQITYMISPEYFTKLKFDQFHYADFGLPERVFVAEIGFLATWWVGFFSAWLITRVTMPGCQIPDVYRKSFKSFAIIFGTALAAALVGFILGATHSSDYSYWLPICTQLGITDTPNFVSVALIHNAGYIGGLLGLVISLIILTRERIQGKGR